MELKSQDRGQTVRGTSRNAIHSTGNNSISGEEARVEHEDEGQMLRAKKRLFVEQGRAGCTTTEDEVQGRGQVAQASHLLEVQDHWILST